MSSSLHNFGRDVIEGKARGVGASLLRGAMCVAEPFYATAIRTRNFLYDRGIKRTHKLPRPTVSVGNITTGGTGKTPVVAWLASRLRESGLQPAILLRGYKVGDSQISDEQVMLEKHLAGTIVKPNPNRRAGADEVLKSGAKIDAFILDDAFQHRKVDRNFDLVLINASEPFGFGRVFPRGLLREPLSGLKRASAFLLTHAKGVAADGEVENTIRRHNPSAPIFKCDHVHTALRTETEDRPIEELRSKKVFAFAGIGDPKSFGASLGNLAGHHWFADHHHYTDADLVQVRREAASADMIVTTEKDWVKIARLKNVNDGQLIVRVVLGLTFFDDDEQKLFSAISASLR